MSARLVALLALALAPAACGGGIPVPRTTTHAGDSFETVPSPPPPGKVEVIPAKPANLKHPVWIDGEWEWASRRWQWKDGRWEEPQQSGFAYAPPLTQRQPDGTFIHWGGTWKKDVPP